MRNWVENWQRVTAWLLSEGEAERAKKTLDLMLVGVERTEKIREQHSILLMGLPMLSGGDVLAIIEAIEPLKKDIFAAIAPAQTLDDNAVRRRLAGTSNKSERIKPTIDHPDSPPGLD